MESKTAKASIQQHSRTVKTLRFFFPLQTKESSETVLIVFFFAKKRFGCCSLLLLAAGTTQRPAGQSHQHKTFDDITKSRKQKIMMLQKTAFDEIVSSPGKLTERDHHFSTETKKKSRTAISTGSAQHIQLEWRWERKKMAGITHLSVWQQQEKWEKMLIIGKKTVERKNKKFPDDVCRRASQPLLFFFWTIEDELTLPRCS